MGIHSIVEDHFFDDPEAIRHHAVTREFKDIRNPEDGVIYPDVSIDVLPSIFLEAVEKIQKLMWSVIIPKKCFLRLSMLGTKAPHQAHTDALLSDYTALIYLSKKIDIPADAGTSIVEHVSGMAVQPEVPEEIALWVRDTNDKDMWKVVGFCPMKFNRLFIVKSELFHRAEPVTGFGETPEDGRLVLTIFFDLPKTK